MAGKYGYEISHETAKALEREWRSGVHGTKEEAFAAVGLSPSTRNIFKGLKQAREITGYDFPRLDGRQTGAQPERKMWASRRKPFDLCYFTDQHYTPGYRYPAHDILLQVLEDHPPSILVCGGDAFNCSTASRHARIAWEERPALVEEWIATAAYMGEIKDAAPRAARYWTTGNHDRNFENYLSGRAPSIEDMPGTRLKDLFPQWQHTTLLWVNRPDEQSREGRGFKHRWHSGTHSAYNNVLKGGVDICTGHTHHMVLFNYSDFAGHRNAVEGGTIADPHSPVFHYLEENPGNAWCEGFVYFRFYGEHSCPEFIEVFRKGSRAYAFFRGKMYSTGV